MRPRKQSAIIASAQQLFLTRGYDATSLDDIAADCGVSKTTVYNNFDDKESLFTAVITQVIGHAESIVEELNGLLTSAAPLESRLESVGRRLVIGVLNPAVVQLRRIAIAEAFRFPELVSSYWEHGPAQTIELLTREFRQLTAAGELECRDARAAAAHFAYAIVGPAQDRALLQPAVTATEAELLHHADSVVDAFLRAYRPGAASRRGAETS